LTYLADSQTNKVWQKHYLLGGGNKRWHPHREWTDDAGVVQKNKSAGTEPFSTGPKQRTEMKKQASDINEHFAHDS